MKTKIFATMLMLFMAFTMKAHDITVHGQVRGESDDEPLVGASVIAVGSATNGVSTDLDGNFSITVPEGTKLAFSYVGYLRQTLEAAQEMNVVLKEDSQALDEVVVVGYSTQRKADLTGSVSVVSTKSLRTTPDSDPMRALQGRVPGMTVSGDGSPSGIGTVRIRGIGSFNASQDPLFVIDGVPTTASLNSLNMNDIESMQVLKDAASASIYGSRAANGVIIITTKSGKGNAGKVNVTALSFKISSHSRQMCYFIARAVRAERL